MNTPRHRPAFTLIEVLVAIALLALLSGAISAFFWNLLDRETRVLGLAGRSRAASVLFDRLERDLFTAVASAPDGPGIVGDETGLIIAHRAVLAGEHPEYDLQRTEIRFDPKAHTLTVTRVDAMGTAADDADEERADAGDVFLGMDGSDRSDDRGVLADNIRYIRLRYHDGREWRSSFTSDRGLPAAVEVAVWYGRASSADDESTDAPSADAFATDGANPASPAGAFPDDAFGRGPAGMTDEHVSPPQREPDRLRVITLPDAPRGSPGAAPSSAGTRGGGS